ncbi:meiotically up-regulated 71 protein [Rhodotorula diobovata]|uniref:Diphthine--ammonia ligase n=1 Tax=Rhodotorula diobovata TaxID=5288 RepID=A0A5C5FRJ7_9BASI|nr:meiotically up-regulated 71 protein [Rhodotorula diobovata]
MKVCALLSGGKDSVYCLHHAVLEGHVPIALASLTPPQGLDELDSFMYQTVGSSGLATLAQALGLPLVTHTIRGTARNQGSQYGSRDHSHQTTPQEQGDETEDLLHLLERVKASYPDVQGITVGAILSNYQRVRVEHVCARLGLVPLAYLWQRDQRLLLAEMVDAGIDSVLVKVAGAGLGIEHLGKSLKEMQPTLLKLNKLYDTHPCGEGGEYETFTLDAPLFLRRVQLKRTTLVTSVADPRATVAHWHLDELALSPLKDAYAGAETGEERWRVGRELCERPSTHQTPDGWVYLAELAAPPAQRGPDVPIEDEVRGCFASLIAALSTHSLTPLDLSHLTIYLSPSASTMALFPRINSVYASFFGTAPPTRACVAVPGAGHGRGWRVKLEGVARGLSYWAPANIGPYSQSILTANRLFTAGQIPLLPSDLSLSPSPSPPPTSAAPHPPHAAYFARSAALAMQHVHRIAAASLPSPSPARRKEGGVLWLAPGGDAREWRGRCGAGGAVWAVAAAGERRGVGEGEGEVEEEEGNEDEDALRGSDDEAEQDDDDDDDEATPPLVIVEAAALPRGAPLEWQVTYCGGGVAVLDGDGADSEEEESEEVRAEKARAARRREEDGRCVRMETVSNTTARPVVYHRSCATPSLSPGLSPHHARGSAFALLACSVTPSRLGADERALHPLPGLARGEVAQVRAFYRTGDASASQVRALAHRVLGIDTTAAAAAGPPALSLVPATRLAVLAQAGEVEEAGVVFVLVGGVE